MHPEGHPYTLTMAILYSEYRSEIGTMWAMADVDEPILAGSFYQLDDTNDKTSDEMNGINYQTDS